MNTTDTVMSDAFARAGFDTDAFTADDDHGDNGDERRAASATAIVCESLALHGAAPGPDEVDNRPLWEAPDRTRTRPHGELTAAQQRTRRIEYRLRSD